MSDSFHLGAADVEAADVEAADVEAAEAVDAALQRSSNVTLKYHERLKNLCDCGDDKKAAVDTFLLLLE